METQSTKPRANWDDNMVKVLLESCIEEVSLNGRKGTSLQPESWINVKKVLKQKCGKDFTQKQMKNEYDYLKDKYQSWYTLTTRTGNIYDPATNTFKLTHEEWNEYIKTHPKASTLRTKPLLYPDLCKALFDGATATGSNAWGPSSKNPRPGSSSSFHSLEDAPIDLDHGDNPSHSPPSSNSFVSPQVQSDQVKDIKPIDEGKRTKRKREKHTPLDEEIVKLVKNLNEEMVKERETICPSVETCLAKLDRLGWNDTSSLYMGAHAIICVGESYRRAWMHLDEENNERIEKWVKTIGKPIGYVVD